MTERAHLLKRFRATHPIDVSDFTDEMVEELVAFQAFAAKHYLRSAWGEISVPLMRLTDWLAARLEGGRR